MFSSETTNQFIELRSQNVSLDGIAKQLGINKSTAIDWQQRYKSRIDELKAVHLEAIRERLTTRYEDELDYAMAELKRIRTELKTRDFDYEPTAFLHYAEATAYRRVQKLCALADFPDQSGRDATPLASTNRESQIQNPESKIENPTVSRPFPHQNNGGRDATPLASAPRSDAPSASTLESKIENPSEIQPFPHQNNGVGAEVNKTGGKVFGIAKHGRSRSLSQTGTKHSDEDQTHYGRAGRGSYRRATGSATDPGHIG